MNSHRLRHTALSCSQFAHRDINELFNSTHKAQAVSRWPLTAEAREFRRRLRYEERVKLKFKGNFSFSPNIYDSAIVTLMVIYPNRSTPTLSQLLVLYPNRSTTARSQCSWYLSQLLYHCAVSALLVLYPNVFTTALSQLSFRYRCLHLTFPSCNIPFLLQLICTCLMIASCMQNAVRENSICSPACVFPVSSINCLHYIRD
jgi:hypothetical protein